MNQKKLKLLQWKLKIKLEFQKKVKNSMKIYKKKSKNNQLLQILKINQKFKIKNNSKTITLLKKNKIMYKINNNKKIYKK